MNREEIIDIVADLYEEYGISELGFSLKMFCNRAEILLIPYSSYGNESNKLKRFDEDGFNLINSESNHNEIYFNDEIRPLERLKFTIPHEIAHICLGHNLCVGKSETERQNREANIFANEFYCPQVLIIHFDLNTKSKLISAFGISAGYAQTLLDKIAERRSMEFSPAEERLLSVFLKNQKDHLNNMKSRRIE